MEPDKKTKDIFVAIGKAAIIGDMGLMMCKDKKTGNFVGVIVVRLEDENGERLVPVARIFDGDPSDEVEPPSGTVVEKPPSSEQYH